MRSRVMGCNQERSIDYPSKCWGDPFDAMGTTIPSDGANAFIHGGQIFGKSNGRILYLYPP
jgi:hypothetical protein